VYYGLDDAFGVSFSFSSPSVVGAGVDAESTCMLSSTGAAGAEGRESKIGLAINDCPVLAILSAYIETTSK
jgi:hypothetical protein